MLTDKKLTVAQPLKHAPSSDADKGKVIDQDPSDGTIVDQNTPVTLTIGDGIQQVTVPNVRGMDAQRAQQEIVDSELKYKEVKVYSASVVKGRVADQDPEPGKQVPPNTTIEVKISQGTEMTSIPEKDALIGKDAKDAEAALTAAQLKWVTSSKASDEPKNQVLELGPDHNPGDAVPVNTVVTLVLSDNSLMKMPDLSNITPDQALAKLSDKSVGWTGSKDSLFQQPDSTTERGLWGKITGQAPKAGDLVSKNTPINVKVGSEPQIPMPLLDGMTQQQALDALHGAGWDGTLTVVTENGQVAPKGKGETVIPGSQSPPASSEIPMTSTVTIHIYPKEAPPTTSSTPTSPTTTASSSSPGETTSSSSSGGGNQGGGGPGRGHGGG